MTLRTPRRRISPRARRRCLAIRSFFQRTFSSLTSPSGIRINSTIAVNVTDLKRKAVREERLLNQNYPNLDVVSDFSRREVKTSTPTESKGINSYKKLARRLCESEDAETKVLYKTSDNLCVGTDSYEHDLALNSNNELRDRPQQSSDRMNYEEYASSSHIFKRKPKNKKYDTSREFHRHRSRLENHETDIIKHSLGLDSYDSHATQILQNGKTPELYSPCFSRQRLEYSRYLPPDEVKIKRRRNKSKRHKSQSPPNLEEIRRKNKKNRPTCDEYYITDVLKQPYKPLNMLARKASNFSRISAPVCRDQRYSTRDMVMADSDMYTCYREPTTEHRYTCAADVTARRSVCDTRLYSAHRKPRLRHRRRYDTDYNDSSLYDVVPVKEKSSPKSRRKFVEENLVLNEAPPSPRTRRPRSNLETQNFRDCEDHNYHANQSRRRSPYRHIIPEYIETFKHEESSEDSPLNGNHRGSPILAMRNTTRLRDTMLNNQQYLEHPNEQHPNEVPPSPKTQRPRLNLETQNYSDYEDYNQQTSRSQRKRSPYQPKRPEYIETFKHDVLSEFPRNGNNIVGPKLATRVKDATSLHGEIGTIMSSQQDLAFPNKDVTHINKTENGNATLVPDKTDKALYEIKNILKTFLQELKKDSSTSQCDQASGTTNKNSGKTLNGSPRESGNETSNGLKNSAASSFNCGLVQGVLPTMPQQFVPCFPNPCYTSMMPVCGAHAVPCLHNSCRVPSCMCVGAGCSHNRRGTEAHDYRSCSRANCTTEADDTKKECESDELIREIYNYVAQNPSMTKKVPSNSFLNRQTTRFPVSMGKSAQRQDAQVGTPPLRCFSKSCEAISSRQLFDTYYAANPSYSDSVLSREAMDYEMPYETNEYKYADKETPKQAPKEQSQTSKFVSALRLLRKNKKNKKEIIHEVCRSEQSIEVDVMPKKRHNFQRDFLTYTMHGQEFLHPPNQNYPSVPRFDYNYSQCDPRMAGYSNPGPISSRRPYYDYIAAQSAPMYEAHNMQPQIPLCLKEIEVRSIGTQSERKAPYFRVFSQRKKAPEVSMPELPPVGILRDDRLRTNMIENPDTGDRKTRKIFTINSKVSATKTEPSLYQKIQKDITNNDAKINNALLKKLFYKRNPFSPQNRFVRTIMEKDTPQFKWRPRFFL